MNKLKLPKRLKPYDFAKKKLHFMASYNLANIVNLNNTINDGSLNIRLEFKLQEGYPIAIGEIDFTTKITCVRCLELLDFNFKNTLKLIFFDAIANQKITKLSHYEVINCKFDDEILTSNLIADEVLLALPMFPKHETLCIDNFKLTKKELNISKREHPFAFLKNFNKDK